MTDCMLSQGSDVFYNLFNQDSYCAIAFPFSKADVAFKDPVLAAKSQSSFGLIPLHIEILYKSLCAPNGPLKAAFAGGHSVSDIASNTQWLFTLATSLQMTKQTVFEYKKENPGGVKEVLLGCAQSPVFLIMNDILFIVNQSIDDSHNRWGAFDPAKGPQEGQIVFGTSELEVSPESTYLIYHRDRGGLSSTEEANKCDYASVPAWSNNDRVKLFSFKA